MWFVPPIPPVVVPIVRHPDRSPPALPCCGLSGARRVAKVVIGSAEEAAMTAHENKGREARNELARALAGWVDEGGAFQPGVDDQATLGEVEERILKSLGSGSCSGMILPPKIQRAPFRHAVA